MKRPRPRHLLIAVISLGSALALLRAFLPAAETVDLGTVTRGPLAVTIDEEGRTRVKERYMLSAPLSGRLSRIALKPGMAVEAGKTVLAVIEPTDPVLLDPRTRAQAQSRVLAGEAAKEQALALLERVNSSLSLAESELRRAHQLHESQGISAQDLEGYEQRAAVARAEAKSAEFQVRIAEYDLEVARALLNDTFADRGSEDAGRRHEIRAPVSGRVLRVLQESATVVALGTPLIEIGDPTDLEVLVEMLSTDAVKIAPGARVIVEQWGGDEPLAARVRVIEPAGFTKISALGVEEQRVNVLADFVGPAEARRSVGDAYRVEVRVVVWENPSVVKVPVGALVRQNEGWAVYLARNKHAVMRPIKVGHRNDREAEVLTGLSEGDVVVLHPGDRIVDGRRIVEREL